MQLIQYPLKEIHNKVKVYCRVRPLDATLNKCLEINQEKSIIIKGKLTKKMEYIFQHVFGPEKTQQEVFEVIAAPLVKELLNSHSSLLYTYGVTGSGKTYTMTGNDKEPGLAPRCLELLFENIHGRQRMGIFKPNNFNSYYIINEHEYCCSVFVNFIEIYNNSIYDLLEESNTPKIPQSKLLRKSALQQMFVQGITEIEVSNTAEAINIYLRGIKRKHMAHTLLNSVSSRSHTVFNIRLVQFNGKLNIGQLSLVDLAGSERCSRTNTTGLRLREACNINNSLMTLRTCLEYLRENQLLPKGQLAKKIPYRDAKITHLFQHFFEGEGQVVMLVCINPLLEDYEENLQLLKFAEMTQEVKTPIIEKEIVNMEVLKLTTNTDFEQLLHKLECRLTQRRQLRETLTSKLNDFQILLSETLQENERLHVELKEKNETNYKMSEEIMKTKQQYEKEQLLYEELKKQQHEMLNNELKELEELKLENIELNNILLKMTNKQYEYGNLDLEKQKEEVHQEKCHVEEKEGKKLLEKENELLKKELMEFRQQKVENDKIMNELIKQKLKNNEIFADSKLLVKEKFKNKQLNEEFMKLKKELEDNKEIIKEFNALKEKENEHEFLKNLVELKQKQKEKQDFLELQENRKELAKLRLLLKNKEYEHEKDIKIQRNSLQKQIHIKEVKLNLISNVLETEDEFFVESLQKSPLPPMGRKVLAAINVFGTPVRNHMSKSEFKNTHKRSHSTDENQTQLTYLKTKQN